MQGGDTDSLASVDSSTLHSTPTTDFDAWNGPAAAAAGADAKINPLAQAQLRYEPLTNRVRVFASSL